MFIVTLNHLIRCSLDYCGWFGWNY